MNVVEFLRKFSKTDHFIININIILYAHYSVCDMHKWVCARLIASMCTLTTKSPILYNRAEHRLKDYNVRNKHACTVECIFLSVFESTGSNHPFYAQLSPSSFCNEKKNFSIFVMSYFKSFHTDLHIQYSSELIHAYFIVVIVGIIIIGIVNGYKSWWAMKALQHNWVLLYLKMKCTHWNFSIS